MPGQYEMGRIAMASAFKVGDRVAVATGVSWTVPSLGNKATVVGGGATRLSVEFDHAFPGWAGHNCAGLAKMGHGQYVNSSACTLIASGPLSSMATASPTLPSAKPIDLRSGDRVQVREHRDTDPFMYWISASGVGLVLAVHQDLTVTPPVIYVSIKFDGPVKGGMAPEQMVPITSCQRLGRSGVRASAPEVCISIGPPSRYCGCSRCVAA